MSQFAKLFCHKGSDFLGYLCNLFPKMLIFTWINVVLWGGREWGGANRYGGTTTLECCFQPNQTLTTILLFLISFCFSDNSLEIITDIIISGSFHDVKIKCKREVCFLNEISIDEHVIVICSLSWYGIFQPRLFRQYRAV